MITGKLNDHIPLWYPEALKQLLDIFRTTDFEGMDAGKYTIDGDDIFFVIDDYTTKDINKTLPESHLSYVDLQFVFRGEEYFGFTLEHENLKESEPYNTEKDICFYHPSPHSQIHFQQGMYIVVMPQEIHTPGLHMPDGSREVRKVVGKIKQSLLQL